MTPRSLYDQTFHRRQYDLQELAQRGGLDESQEQLLRRRIARHHATFDRLFWRWLRREHVIESRRVWGRYCLWIMPHTHTNP